MPTLGKKQARRLLNRLHAIRETSTMERASFGDICNPRGLVRHPDGSPVLEQNLTKFIRERTRIWRESWITQQLDDVIEQLKEFT